MKLFLTLKPGGLFTICVWLTCDNPGLWEIGYLLEPICREGGLPSIGNEADNRSLALKTWVGVVNV